MGALEARARSGHLPPVASTGSSGGGDLTVFDLRSSGMIDTAVWRGFLSSVVPGFLAFVSLPVRHYTAVMFPLFDWSWMHVSGNLWTWLLTTDVALLVLFSSLTGVALSLPARWLARRADALHPVLGRRTRQGAVAGVGLLAALVFVVPTVMVQPAHGLTVAVMAALWSMVAAALTVTEGGPEAPALLAPGRALPPASGRSDLAVPPVAGVPGAARALAEAGLVATVSLPTLVLFLQSGIAGKLVATFLVIPMQRIWELHAWEVFEAFVNWELVEGLYFAGVHVRTAFDMAFTLALLVPATGILTRVFRRLMPSASRRALALGLLLPVAYLTVAIAAEALQPLAYLGLCVPGSWLAGGGLYLAILGLAAICLGPHGVAVWLGLRERPRPAAAALPSGEEEPPRLEA